MKIDLGDAPLTPAAIAAAIASAKIQGVNEYLALHPPIRIRATATIVNLTGHTMRLKMYDSTYQYMTGSEISVPSNSSMTNSSSVFVGDASYFVYFVDNPMKVSVTRYVRQLLGSPTGDASLTVLDNPSSIEFLRPYDLNDDDPQEIVITLIPYNS